MILYHGSNTIIEKPTLIQPTRRLDFGSGFYTTTSEKQAIDFTYKVKQRALKLGIENQGSYVSIYEIDFEKLISELSVLRFTSPNNAWFDFVMANRRGTYRGEKYDAIYGPVANDTVFRTLTAFENLAINKATAIRRLKTYKLHDQLVFCTERGLSFLQYTGFKQEEG
jgi:hypothetical protein